MAKHDNDDDSWWHFILIGFLMVITPMAQMMRDGFSDSDLIRWLMSKPLGFHQFIRFSIYAGIGLIFLGMAWFYFVRL
jgi:hypothetical protein